MKPVLFFSGASLRFTAVACLAIVLVFAGSDAMAAGKKKKKTVVAPPPPVSVPAPVQVIVQAAPVDKYQQALEAYAAGDYGQAANLWRDVAQRGDMEAQNMLGFLYINGQGVRQDYAEALKWYQKAALQGHADAQTNLGLMYRHGQGVLQDYTEALKWYQKAAAQGNASAYYNLGEMYSEGWGVLRDPVAAAGWYQRAASLNDVFAQERLGLMYRDGIGLKQDFVQANRLLGNAGQGGNAQAWADLGWMSEHGMGESRDLDKALALYKQAGTDWAKKRAQRLQLRQQCSATAITELLGIKLACTDRDTLRLAVVLAGGEKPQPATAADSSGDWRDIYQSGAVFQGTSELTLAWSGSDNLAYARYTFPSPDPTQGPGLAGRVKELVVQKYGAPMASEGMSNLGPVSYSWTLPDGIELKVHRAWPDTTTFLTFVNPPYKAALEQRLENRFEQQQQQVEKAQPANSGAF